jgi:hypothetical protein
MNWRWLLPLLSLLAVGWCTLRDLTPARLSPGPLHGAHAALPVLAGGSNCAACHGEGDGHSGIAAAACGTCHAPIAAQMAADVGVHGRLPSAEREHCGRCHGEHHGDAVALVPPHAFVRAGIPDLAAYDHQHVDFRLGGVHRTLACDRCHPQATASVPHGPRFLGRTQACSGCHDDVHDGAFGADCAGCHSQEAPFQP